MQRPIVFYDGTCGMCNAAVRWILRHESTPDFLFCSLQSERAGEWLAGLVDIKTTDSMVLLDGSTAYLRSTAVLKIAGALRFPYRLLSIGLVVPSALRDPFYRFIAKYRKRLFPRNEVCLWLNEEQRARFLD